MLKALSELLVNSRKSNEAAFVVGEPGVGKTRLAEVLAHAAQEAGVRVVWGRPQQFAEDFPYLAFLQIANQLKEGVSAGRAGAVLEATSTEWASLSVDTRATRTRFILEATNKIIEQVAARSTMIIIDDLQWADIASLLLVSSLLDVLGHGLFLVCLSRPQDSGRPNARGLLNAIRTRSRAFDLQGLDDVELNEFTMGLLGRGVLSREEVEALCNWTNGNPLFVRTLLAHLDEAGLLTEHGLDEALRRAEMPSGVLQASKARIAALGPRVRRALSAAAVLGEEFERCALVAVLGETEDGVAGQLAAAREKGIVAADRGLRDDRLRFCHSLYRRALYDQLAPSKRRELHRRVIEISTQGVLSLSSEELATHHALSTGSQPNQEAANHCRSAARHAERLLAYESAARFWEMALDCTDQSNDGARAELLKRQGWALWAANSWKRGEAAWREAVHLYEGLGEPGEVAQLALAIGDMLRWRHDLEPSEGWLNRALTHLPENSLGRARALALLGGIQCIRDASEKGLLMLQEASDMTQGTGMSDARIDYWLAYGLRRAGDRAGAKAVGMRGLEHAERNDDVHGAIVLAGSLANAELIELKLAASNEYMARVDRFAGQADTGALMILLETKAYQLGYRGQWQEVAALCESTMARLRLAGSYQVASAKVIWAEAQFALGRWETAVSTMQKALPSLEQMKDVCRVHIARVIASSGQGEQVSEDVRAYLGTASEPANVRSGIAVLGDAAAAINEPDLWSPAYGLVLNERAAVTLVYSPTSVDRVRGRLATRLKKWTDAIDHFESAKKQLSDGEATWELLRTCQDYAVMRRSRGRRGDMTKAEALELFVAQIAQEKGVSAPLLAEPFSEELQRNSFGLSGREVDVLRLVAAGLRNKDVADQLSLSPHTVERHLENIYAKMDVRGRTEAVMRAAEGGVLTRPHESS